MTALLQEFTTAGRLQVHDLECEQPLSFPVTSRTGYQISDLDEYRGSAFMAYSYVLVMDVGSYPVQLTARTSGSSSVNQPMCALRCCGDLAQERERCQADETTYEVFGVREYGCKCGASAGAHQMALMVLHSSGMTHKRELTHK